TSRASRRDPLGTPDQHASPARGAGEHDVAIEPFELAVPVVAKALVLHDTVAARRRDQEVVASIADLVLLPAEEVEPPSPGIASRDRARVPRDEHRNELFDARDPRVLAAVLRGVLFERAADRADLLRRAHLRIALPVDP